MTCNVHNSKVLKRKICAERFKTGTILNIKRLKLEVAE